MFEKDSRYYNITKTFFTRSDGRKIVYIERRFIPKIRVNSYQKKQCIAGDRLDLIAYKLFNEPDEYWRICDVNEELNPCMLLSQPGAWINIPNTSTNNFEKMKK